MEVVPVLAHRRRHLDAPTVLLPIVVILAHDDARLASLLIHPRKGGHFERASSASGVVEAKPARESPRAPASPPSSTQRMEQCRRRGFHLPHSHLKDPPERLAVYRELGNVLAGELLDRHELAVAPGEIDGLVQGGLASPLCLAGGGGEAHVGVRARWVGEKGRGVLV